MKIIDSLLFFLSYQLKLTKLPYPPRFVYIEPTNACNLGCTMCPQNNMKSIRNIKHMDMVFFRDVIKQLKSLRPMGVVFHLGGEPLLNPNLSEMIAEVNKLGIYTTFSTNGMLLTKAVSEKLIDSGLDKIRIDFYADKEKYESMRKGAKWEVVRDNIQGLLDLKQRKGAVKPLLKIQELHLRDENFSPSVKINRIKGLFNGLPDNSVEVGTVHTFSGNFADQLKDDPHYKISRDPEDYYPCRHAWTGIAITTNGYAVPCCRDMLGVHKLASVRERSIADIWNGKEYVELREKLKNGKYYESEICKNCTALWEGKKPLKLVADHFMYAYVKGRGV